MNAPADSAETAEDHPLGGHLLREEPWLRAVLQRAGEQCPVKRSLEGSVAMELHWQTLRAAAG